MTRRNLELTLLCIAAPIVILMFAMMVANQGQPLDFNTLGVPIGIFLTYKAAVDATLFSSDHYQKIFENIKNKLASYKLRATSYKPPKGQKGEKREADASTPHGTCSL